MSNYSPQFKNDFQHSFMYLHSVPQEENHEQKILRQCQIPGTLSFRLLEEEGENFLQYDFSPYQRACLYFSQRKIRLQHLSSLFSSLQNALRNMEEYLLSPSLLSIEWEEIFYDVENQHFLFPLIPFKKEYPEEGLSALLEQVLENIDEEEEAVVLAAFLLYQEQKHGGLQLSRILQILHIQEQKQLVPKSEEKAISLSNAIQKSPHPSSQAFSGEKASSRVFPKPLGEKTTTAQSLEDSGKNYTELDLCQCSTSSFQKQEQETPEFATQSAVDSNHFQEEHSYTDAANTIPKKKGFLASLHLPCSIASPASSPVSPPVSSLADREQKKRKKEGRKKMLLGIFLMLFLPLALFYFKGSGFLFHYLPFVILLELALLLYTALDYLILLLSSPGSEDKQKCKTSG
ncbi:DUF6382 domain-containing protein [Oribacterium sinus]|jgi:hypothetical protein|uniref:DUF6382 domain-containing protein n=1 Tax=Oribacterium sinus TaxID=237576 RepID=UPI0028D40FF7|nr:DUF6382 domain-containing protein [Oribacterium sinus]